MRRRFNLNEFPRQHLFDVLRKPNINSSETATVLGESAWGSPAILYAEKKGLRPPAEDTDIFTRGRWGEAAVFEALAELRPEWEVKRASVYVVDEEKRQGSTPDGFARAPDRPGIGAVQTKVVSSSVFRSKWLVNPDIDPRYGDSELPAAYRIQAIQDMRLNECQWAVVPVLVVTEYRWIFRMFDVEHDDVLADRIDAGIARFFADYLDPGIMPPFEFPRDAELVRRLYPKDAGTTIDLAGDNRAAELADHLTEVQAGVKRLEKQEADLKAELEAKLGPNTFGLLQDGRCLSWRTHNRKGYTVAPSTYRQFRILKQAPEETPT